MATGSKADHSDGTAARNGIPTIILLIATSVLPLVAIPGLAQDTARATTTTMNPPSLPVRGPRVLRSLPPPDAISSTPAELPPPEHMVGIMIAGFPFMMHPGPCAHSVEAAILAHDDLFTGDSGCDTLIKQARAIQRQKEAEDPSYAKEPRITPQPTPRVSGNNQTQR